jgi:hypothetical protein
MLPSLLSYNQVQRNRHDQPRNEEDDAGDVQHYHNQMWHGFSPEKSPGACSRVVYVVDNLQHFLSANRA